MSPIDFAFLGHPASLDHVADLLPRVRPGLDAARARSHKALLAKAFEWSPPVVTGEDLGLARADGSTLRGKLIICTFLPEHAHSPRQLSAAYQKTRSAAFMARDLGARIIGLGGFTSIVGGAQEEKLPRELGIAATSGNSLTAALAMEQIRSLLAALGWALGDKRVAILGATGDIGQACARALIETLGARRLRLIARNRVKLETLRASLANRGLDLQTSTDPAEARQADLIVAATSTALPLLAEPDLRAGSIVCDIGYPATLAYAASPRPDVLAFAGGLAQSGYVLPLAPYTLLPSPDLLHGCFAETLTLALAGRYESYSLGQGRITSDRMAAILKLALGQGFLPAPIFRGGRLIETADLEVFLRSPAPPAL
jgi:fatty aldehyde-generating acyl-ACP reductase